MHLVSAMPSVLHIVCKSLLYFSPVGNLEFSGPAAQSMKPTTLCESFVYCIDLSSTMQISPLRGEDSYPMGQVLLVGNLGLVSLAKSALFTMLPSTTPFFEA